MFLPTPQVLAECYHIDTDFAYNKIVTDGRLRIIYLFAVTSINDCGASIHD